MYNLVYCGIILCIVVASSHHRHHTHTLATIVPGSGCNRQFLSSVQSAATNSHLPLLCALANGGITPINNQFACGIVIDLSFFFRFTNEDVKLD